METLIADDGEVLHLRISGSGLPVLFLHGWTSSHTVWRPLLDSLSAQHQLYRPDARGHGGHPLSVTPTPDVARLARDVLNLLDYYQLDKVAVVGHSMGALTLWQFIRDYGCERLSHICVIDQSPKLMTDVGWSNGIYGDFDATRSQLLIEHLERDFPEAVMQLIAYGLNLRARETYERNSSGWQATRDSLQQLKPGPQIAIWKSLVAADYRAVLPEINVPALLAFGQQSNFYTAATAQYLLEQIPSATLSCYEGADHCPQLLQPERFSSELIEFFRH